MTVKDGCLIDHTHARKISHSLEATGLGDAKTPVNVQNYRTTLNVCLAA